MKRTRDARGDRARAQYMADCSRFGVARADELAHARQLNVLDLLSLTVAEELL